MSVRQIVLDTETTGLDWRRGDRVIEVACVEMVGRKLTGRHFHRYVNPERDIDAGAQAVHGLTVEFLADKPKFADIVADFEDFVRDAELVIHNASFDVGFLDAELERLGRAIAGTLAGLDAAERFARGTGLDVAALFEAYNQRQPAANTLELTRRLDATLADIQKSLPAGMKIETRLFRQADFIEVSIANLMAALRDYPMPKRRRITIEYTLVRGKNDSPEHAHRLAALLREERRTPAFWARDLDRLADVLRERVEDPDRAIPFELLGRHDRAEARAVAVRRVREYGELLVHWPALWEAARSLRASGHLLGEVYT